ncbi:MAG: hypothetical protein K0R24_1246 [Gammaproteobacteria bacterium]|jgi:hypothetical protein|nr:hypothetical protein [Gammaproteobacteria bacterium]
MASKTSKNLAINILKAELAKRGLSFQKLHENLKATGINDSYNNMRLKINRGAFTFAYFLDCMRAIDLKTLDLESYFTLGYSMEHPIPIVSKDKRPLNSSSSKKTNQQ